MLASKKEYCMTKILTGNAVKSGKSRGITLKNFVYIAVLRQNSAFFLDNWIAFF